MNPEQIDLVRQSWPRLQPRRDEIAALFYGRLFEIAPETRAMFAGDMAAQGAKLMATLHVAVEHLDDLAPLEGTLAQLAQRHLQWGVGPAHYDRVGDALVWSLRLALGQAEGDPLLAAWAAAYDAVAQPMKAAAYLDRN